MQTQTDIWTVGQCKRHIIIAQKNVERREKFLLGIFLHFLLSTLCRLHDLNFFVDDPFLKNTLCTEYSTLNTVNMKGTGRGDKLLVRVAAGYGRVPQEMRRVMHKEEMHLLLNVGEYGGWITY